MKKIKIGFLLLISIYIFTIISFSEAKYVMDISIVAIKLTIDRTPPIAMVTYSWDKDILVTISANESILNVDSWKLSEDKQTLTKIYPENIIDEIKIIDLSGNERNIVINTKMDSKENVNRSKLSVDKMQNSKK